MPPRRPSRPPSSRGQHIEDAAHRAQEHAAERGTEARERLDEAGKRIHAPHREGGET
jgi:hypothetical protein